MAPANAYLFWGSTRVADMATAYANFAELCLLKSIAEWSLAMTVCRALAMLDCTDIRALTEVFFIWGTPACQHVL